MYPHRIYLHGPWQHSLTGARLMLPARGSFYFSSRQPVRLRRPFRWPTALLPFERLWLTASCNRPMEVLLDGASLGRHADARLPFEQDITARVQAANTLELVMADDARDFVLGPIYLEVRRDIHLADIVGETLWETSNPQLRLTARLVGESARLLSVVLRVDNREVLYQELPTASERIDVVTPPLDVRRWQPGRANELHHLECHLLDPACVLSQHSFLTGFRQVEAVGAGEFRINGSPFPGEAVAWDKPLDESATLAKADREGRLLVLANAETARSYLWYHPSVLGGAS